MNIRLFCESVADLTAEWPLFCESVADLTAEWPLPPNGMGASIFNQLSHLPKWRDIDIALIGADAQGQSANLVRKHFYQLQKSHEHYRLADLGNLQLADDPAQTLMRLREVCEHLLQQGVLPVVISDSPEMQLATHWAYESLGKQVYVLQADACLPLNDADSLFQKLISHQPNYLAGMGLLGYQQYLLDPAQLVVWQKLGFDLMSLGKAREDFKEVEPVVRLADALHFQVRALKKGDAPANTLPYPFGFTGEEACQVAWYAGLSDKLSTFGLYGYQAERDRDEQTAALLAVMLWYLVEGYYHRSREMGFGSDFFFKYSVPLAQEQLVFYKNRRNEQWWLAVPVGQAFRDQYGEHCMVPCSYRDYQQASEGLLPERWIKAVERFG